MRETSTDIAAEQSFAALLTGRGFFAARLRKYYPFDLWAEHPLHGQMFIEYKRRHFHSGRYATAFFPAGKLAQCRSWARALGIPFFIFMQYDDQILYCNGNDVRFTVRFTGRKDRDFDESEPMVEINLEDFRRFSLRRGRDQINTVSHGTTAKPLIYLGGGMAERSKAPDCKSY